MMNVVARIAYLSLALFVGCSAKDNGGVSSGSGNAEGDSAGNGTGGSTGDSSGNLNGQPSGNGNNTVEPGGSSGSSTGGFALPPTSTDFIEDRSAQAGLPPNVLEELKGSAASGAGRGGSGLPECATGDLIYPYTGTVMPGGLVSPPMMWNRPIEAVYLSARYEGLDTLDYQYAAGASNPGELRIPAEDWAEITRRSQGQRLLISLSVRGSGGVTSCDTHWRIAAGNMIGALYYNTYNHPDAGGLGAVLRLTLGDPSPQLYLNQPLQGPSLPTGPCISCHSVSADGSTMAASLHNYAPGADVFGLVEPFTASAYTVSDALQPQARSRVADATFGGLTPDGSLILQMGNPDCTAGADTFPRSPRNFMLAQGPTTASLIDTRTNQPVAAQGLNPDWYMWMPQFSPDGKHVVFNHAKPDGQGGTDRRQLAMMDFDPDTRTFSNLKVLVSGLGATPNRPYTPGAAAIIPGAVTVGTGAGGCTQRLMGEESMGHIPQGSCDGPCYPAWPFFTPDGKGVIFSLVSEPDFAVAFPGRPTPSKSELWYVDVDNPENPIRMDNANRGLVPDDSLANYYPTVLPIQVGGYYWVFWTSMRAWGHRNLEAPPEALLGGLLLGEAVLDAFKKRIWVSAIRPRVQTQEFADVIRTDPSAPGFYLEGQSETGNTRAFATLNPCKPLGNECTSGLDCCEGFCTIEEGAASGVCVEEQECAELNERCEVDADCCDPSHQCLGGYCGFVVVQ